MKEKDKPETIAVSAGRMTKEHYGAVNTPVYRTSTILHPSYESLKTEALPYKYGRQCLPRKEKLKIGSVCLLPKNGARTLSNN